MIYRVLSGLALLAGFALYPGVSRADTIVRCESHDYNRNECMADTRGGVSIVNQVSDSTCIEGRNWGYGRGHIWVDDGCAAEFRVGDRYSYRDDRYRGRDYVIGRSYASAGGVVTCESIDNQRETCEIPRNSGVRLLNQISDSPCVRGRTWGAYGRRIWVDDGCRAEFQVLR
jgi:hypothetical protein